MRTGSILASAMLLGGCYTSFVVPEGGGDAGAGLPSDASAGLPVTFSDGYELNHDTIPGHPWLDAPPSGAECWPVSVSPRFTELAVSNLEAALATWETSCTRFCFEALSVREVVDDEPSPSLEGLVFTFDGEFVQALPRSSGADGHGFFGDIRTESVTIVVGPGRTPSVREWARSIGLATGLRVTDSEVPSVLRESGLSETSGATATDRGALCRHFPL